MRVLRRENEQHIRGPTVRAADGHWLLQRLTFMLDDDVRIAKPLGKRVLIVLNEEFMLKQ